MVGGQGGQGGQGFSKPSTFTFLHLCTGFQKTLPTLPSLPYS